MKSGPGAPSFALQQEPEFLGNKSWASIVLFYWYPIGWCPSDMAIP
ncbi:MAG: hypothetical protein JWO71_1736 [Candidatus Acidoferrum typicum]|nr:hypothetical protein [Candidatus Acidoferrum typicum]